MDFNPPLLKGQLLRRYKRFFADVELPNGQVVVAHCPNTGSMQGLLEEGHSAYITPHNDPKRKLQYTLEIIGTPTGLVGVHTGRPNKLVAAAIAAGQVPELAGYSTLKPEVKYGTNSRIDLLLTDPVKPDCYVEVKNTTLKAGDAAQFPDAVTSRGLKHLHELTQMVKTGSRAVMFYWVNRNDCAWFEPARSIDPAYADGLRQAAKQGVEILAYACDVQPNRLSIGQQLDIKLC